MYGKFNYTLIWVVRKNKQRGKTFKYVYFRNSKELLKHILLAVNSTGQQQIWYNNISFLFFK